MSSPNLDNFYLQINKSILLAEDYIGSYNGRGLSLMLRTCRFKPYELIYDREKYTIRLYRKWIDEFNNSINFTLTKYKNKSMKVIYNDLSLKENVNICTDIYYGLSIDKIAKISYIVHLFIGNDDGEDQIIISFLGIDNYFRSYILTDDGWKIIGTIILGIGTIKNIIKNCNIQFFTELEVNNRIVIPSHLTRTTEWISRLSDKEGNHKSQKVFIETVKNKHNIDLSFLE